MTHLRSGRSLMGELGTRNADKRRFAYVVHVAEDLQKSSADSEDRRFFVGTLELPTELLEAEARGEVRDQADCRERIDHCTAHGASEAVAAIQQIVGDQKFIQPLQDEYEFSPPVLV
ncbi:MAG: hypothetical protein AAFQ65_01510 [Myxococcota bacterium]